MATMCNKKPSKVSFAGNPVLVQVFSPLTGKKFLSVHLSVQMTLIQEGVQVRTSSSHLSLPTAGGSEPVMFNLSAVLCSALSGRSVAPLRGTSSGRQAGGYLRYTFTHWDEYVDDRNVTVSSAKVTENGFYAIDGGYSDIQRMLGSEDTAAVLGSQKLLTNRPEWLIHVAGFPFVIPMFRFSEALTLTPESVPVHAVDAKGVSVQVGTVVGKPNEVESVLLDKEWKALKPGNYTVADQLRVTVAPPDERAVYFEFVNRLGALESVVCYFKPVEKYKFQSERNVRHQNYAFQPTARWVRRVSSEEYTISASTGPLNRLQAQWFVQEFFQSSHCWMFDKEIGKMVPVVIESDSSDVYNFAKPGVIDLEFDIVRCFNGYHTGGIFSKGAL